MQQTVRAAHVSQPALSILKPSSTSSNVLRARCYPTKRALRFTIPSPTHSHTTHHTTAFQHSNHRMLALELFIYDSYQIPSSSTHPSSFTLYFASFLFIRCTCHALSMCCHARGVCLFMLQHPRITHFSTKRTQSYTNLPMRLLSPLSKLAVGHNQFSTPPLLSSSQLFSVISLPSCHLHFNSTNHQRQHQNLLLPSVSIAKLYRVQIHNLKAPYPPSRLQPISFLQPFQSRNTCTSPSCYKYHFTTFLILVRPSSAPTSQIDKHRTMFSRRLDLCIIKMPILRPFSSR